jgi:hypothetical protein
MFCIKKIDLKCPNEYLDVYLTFNLNKKWSSKTTPKIQSDDMITWSVNPNEKSWHIRTNHDDILHQKLYMVVISVDNDGSHTEIGEGFMSLSKMIAPSEVITNEGNILFLNLFNFFKITLCLISLNYRKDKYIRKTKIIMFKI